MARHDLHRHDRRPAEDVGPRPARPTDAQLGALGRLGRWVSRHHRWAALVWIALVVLGGYLNAADARAVSDDFSIPGSDSQAAYDLLEQAFSSQNDATATVVYTVPAGQRLTDPANAATVASVTAALGRVEGVASVADPLTSDPQEALRHYAGTLSADEAEAVVALAPDLPPTVSSDGRTAYAAVTFEATLPELLSEQPVNAEKPASDYPNPYSALEAAVATVPTGDVTVHLGGPVADTYNGPVSWWANHADEVGLALGAVLLLIAFGSLFAMAVPIATALFGAFVAGGLVYFLASVTTVSSAAPPVTMMISIGVGLDYSLLIVTRHRQHLADGHRPDDACGLALSSAGKAALFAGMTVCIALLGLWLVPIPLVQTLGLSAAIGVAVMILAATTLLPTLLGFAGAGLDRVRLPFDRASAHPDPERSFWGRFARTMGRRPRLTLVVGTVALLALAAPFLRIQFGMPDDSSLPAGLSQRQAFEAVQAGFGEGVNGPLIVAVSLPEDEQGPFEKVLTTLEPVSQVVGALRPAGTVDDVEYSLGPIPNDVTTTSAVVYQITPQSSPDSAETKQLVADLRSSLEQATAGTGLEAHVGGSTATLIDLTSLVVRYLPIVIAAVVLGSFLLLVLVFRSILVPLKAAAMNLLSIAAAYGVVVAVFQWGWFKGAVGLSSTIPIVSFVPLVMFVILFGLSMDYEVFLMSRIREKWDRTGDPRRSVVLGVADTGRVITTAALIMIAVFASFVTNQNPTVKLIGFGMAVAVLIDSTIVRMVLVPAVMELLGKAAWWFPRWLEWLPRLDVEGPVEPEAAVPAALPQEREPVGAGAGR